MAARELDDRGAWREIVRCRPAAKRIDEPHRCGATVRPLRRRPARDALRLGDAAGDGGIGLADVDRPRSIMSRKAKRVCSLSPAAIGMSVERRTSAWPTRLSARRAPRANRDRALDLAREALGFAHAPRAVGVHHDADVRSERLAHLAHARRRVVDAPVLKADPQLDRTMAALDVLGKLGADAADGRPATTRIGGDALAVANAEQAPHRARPATGRADPRGRCRRH